MRKLHFRSVIRRGVAVAAATTLALASISQLTHSLIPPVTVEYFCICLWHCIHRGCCVLLTCGTDDNREPPSLMLLVNVVESCSPLCGETGIRARKSQKAFSDRRKGVYGRGVLFKIKIPGPKGVTWKPLWVWLYRRRCTKGKKGNDEKRRLGEKRGTLIFIPATSESEERVLREDHTRPHLLPLMSCSHLHPPVPLAPESYEREGARELGSLCVCVCVYDVCMCDMALAVSPSRNIFQELWKILSSNVPRWFITVSIRESNNGERISLPFGEQLGLASGLIQPFWFQLFLLLLFFALSPFFFFDVFAYRSFIIFMINQYLLISLHKRTSYDI